MTLKAKQIEHAKVGMHADGGGLYLRVQAKGAKSWIYRYQLNGRRREMGIGTLVDKPAPDAREAAADLAKLVRSGVDPIDQRNEVKERDKRKAGDTFKELATEYVEAHRAGWRNAKHADQWTNTLTTYAHPFIGSKLASEVNINDVLAILKPIWSTKTETASRVRSRIELVLSYAKARKLREGENPAAWRGNLDSLLPKPNKLKDVRHYPALPYTRMAEFMTALRGVDGDGARALEFAILTAARSGEVRGATWAEIDLEGKVWTVPAERMKAEREHRVPLSAAAIKLLSGRKVKPGGLIFTGLRASKNGPRALSDMSLLAVIRRMNEPTPQWLDPKNGAQVVPHGFRSSFRDWAAEVTTFPNEMVEMALAHTVGNKVEAAYRRGDMFAKRMELMEAWSMHIC
jgi:integrase